jgi:hypothetical protein
MYKYNETLYRITLGMESGSFVPASRFKTLFQSSVPDSVIEGAVKRSGPVRRCPPRLSALELIQSRVFHAVAGAGTLAQHVNQ